MFILSICDNAEILSILRLIKIVIGIIRVVVPILLILSLSLEFAKAIMSSDSDLLKSASFAAVKKCIAAVLIFFIPTFMNMIGNVTSDDGLYKTCLENATVENIDAAFEVRAQTLMARAKDNISNTSYQLAKLAVKKINDPILRSQYEEELQDLKVVIRAQELINYAAKTLKEEDYEAALETVELIEDENIKNELNLKLESVAAMMSVYAEEYSSDGYTKNPLGLPYYDQCDPRWKNTKYDTGGGFNGGMATVCSSACGYVSFSMVAAGLNKDMSITPLTVIEKMRGINLSQGEYTTRGGGAAGDGELISDAYMKYYNLKAEVLFYRGHGSGSLFTKTEVMKALNSGKAVVLLRPWHYVTLVGDGKGKIILLDPNHADKNGTYTIDKLYNLLQSQSASPSNSTFVYAIAYSAR